MPIHEYRCPHGHVFERIDLRAGVAPDETWACPECGAEAARQFPRSNWQFGEGPKESTISAAIGRVKRAEREGRL